MQIDASSYPSTAAYGHSFARGQADTLATSIRATRSQQAALEVVTAEGDRVSLTAANREDLSLDRYETQIRTAAGEASRQVESFSLRNTSSFALEVVGDLNEEELADIEQLIQDMEKMGASLLSGTLDTGLQLGSSLAAATGQLSVSEEITASLSRSSRSLGAGRAQRRAARQAGDIVRRQPERAQQLQAGLPKIADRVFDRLGDAFGAAPAEAARNAFQSVLGEELRKAVFEVESGFSVQAEVRVRNPYQSLAADPSKAVSAADDDASTAVDEAEGSADADAPTITIEPDGAAADPTIDVDGPPTVTGAPIPDAPTVDVDGPAALPIVNVPLDAPAPEAKAKVAGELSVEAPKTDAPSFEAPAAAPVAPAAFRPTPSRGIVVDVDDPQPAEPTAVESEVQVPVAEPTDFGPQPFESSVINYQLNSSAAAEFSVSTPQLDLNARLARNLSVQARASDDRREVSAQRSREFSFEARSFGGAIGATTGPATTGPKKA